ncbi:hypothetical protein G6F37_009911 [Rhizopus arrhizus]|nr:hypothetical protein G6F38_009845 [Rhizopus arrhizus]KAG1153931.1 hypothetical protein G6F37_009911 [Rhizopus arrhizus]
MYSSEIHLPILITNHLSEHSLPWNNLDQLSSLWSIFTKYKSNIRDGFRLENLSWRLWYRQSVLQKKRKPNTVKDIDYDSAKITATTTNLKRTRSLPNIKQQQQHQQLMTRKFFIDEQPIKKKLILRRTSNLPKPVSLLSEMLSRTTDTAKSSGLRRCQSRYCRLDQFFLNAA